MTQSTTTPDFLAGFDATAFFHPNRYKVAPRPSKCAVEPTRHQRIEITNSRTFYESKNTKSRI